jgi:hypothetical protein
VTFLRVGKKRKLGNSVTTADDNRDPISAASSGLRALGVAPQRRVETLGLLSALIDLADESGEVLLDTALMQTEERLGIDACLEGYEWLERLDVIRRTWSGWVIQNFGEHHGPVGMTEASLAVLQRHLAAKDDAPVVAFAPEPTAAVIPLKSWRRRVPVIAASVAAGVAALAGATQLVPQAAVTTRNASHANQPAAVVAGAPTTVASAATSAVATTAAGTADTASAGGESPAVTTTTSTTLLPEVPCIGDVLRGLGSRTGLRTPPTTAASPSLLPCP